MMNDTKHHLKQLAGAMRGLCELILDESDLKKCVRLMSRQLDNFADKMDEIRILANRRHEEIKSLRAQVKALKKSLKKKC